MPTANHDFSRLACGPRAPDQLPAAFTFVLTWPTVPAIYYGDEIGMRHLSRVPDREGSRPGGPASNRAGARTPMQWAPGPAAGFSAAPPHRLYLPLDPDPGRPNVADQRADPGSLLHTVRRLLKLRATHPDLAPDSPVRLLNSGYPLVYRRGQHLLIAVNPQDAPVRLPVPGKEWRPLLAERIDVIDGELTAAGHGWGIFEIH